MRAADLAAGSAEAGEQRIRLWEESGAGGGEVGGQQILRRRGLWVAGRLEGVDSAAQWSTDNGQEAKTGLRARWGVLEAVQVHRRPATASLAESILSHPSLDDGKLAPFLTDSNLVIA